MAMARKAHGRCFRLVESSVPLSIRVAIGEKGRKDLDSGVLVENRCGEGNPEKTERKWRMRAEGEDDTGGSSVWHPSLDFTAKVAYLTLSTYHFKKAVIKKTLKWKWRIIYSLITFKVIHKHPSTADLVRVALTLCHDVKLQLERPEYVLGIIPHFFVWLFTEFSLSSCLEEMAV